MKKPAPGPRRPAAFPLRLVALTVLAGVIATPLLASARAKKPNIVLIMADAMGWSDIGCYGSEIARYAGKYESGWDTLQRHRHTQAVKLGLIDPKWTLPGRDPEVQPWENAPNRAWQMRRMETYAAMIDSMDQGIGRILAAPDASGASKNTLVLFLSDNGSCAETPGGNDPQRIPRPKEHYTHCGPDWAFARNSPFQRYKSRMHEGGIATPLDVRSPALIPAGTLIRQVGHIIDLLPTFLDVAGVKYPETREGKTLLPLEGLSLAPIMGHPQEGSIARPAPLFRFYSMDNTAQGGLGAGVVVHLRARGLIPHGLGCSNTGSTPVLSGDST